MELGSEFDDLFRDEWLAVWTVVSLAGVHIFASPMAGHSERQPSFDCGSSTRLVRCIELIV